MNNKVDDIIVLKEFSFVGKEGKTAHSHWRHNEQFPRFAKFIITEVEEKEGQGFSGKCIPDIEDVQLMEYLERMAEKESDGLFVCYWNEDNIVEIY